jgi:hypothetical protein
MTKADVNSLHRKYGDEAVVYLDEITKEELEERIRKAAANGHGAGNGEPPEIGEPPEEETFDSRFTFTNIGAIKEPILDGAFAIDGLLLQEGIASFYGPRSSGKAFGTLHAMLHVATGRPYNGRPTEKLSCTSWRRVASFSRTGSWRPKRR